MPEAHEGGAIQEQPAHVIRRNLRPSAPLQALFFLQVVGLSLAMCQQFIDLARVKAFLGSPFYHLADTAWPLSHLFIMMVVGINVLVTRRLRGQFRFAPLGCGLALSLAIAAWPKLCGLVSISSYVRKS
jgi:hypothetical protein